MLSFQRAVIVGLQFDTTSERLVGQWQQVGERLPARLSIFGAVMLVGGALAAGSRPAQAAEITWGSPFEVQAPTDILLPTGGTIHFAADFNTEAGFDPDPDDDDAINGIPFTRVDGAGIADLLSHSFSGGPNFGAAAYPGGSGDADLDNLLNSHSWHGGDPQTASVTIEGLTVGLSYQVQVVGAVDLRDCCAARVYEPDDGQGNFDTGTSIQRGLVQSVVGTFAADSSSQTFQWRSLNNVEGNPDPGMSGLLVSVLPDAPTGVVSATLNRDTGNLSIHNGTSSPFDMLGYTISSGFGSLDPVAWTSIADNYDQDADSSIDGNDSWTVASAENGDLSEVELNIAGAQDGGAIGAGQTLDLGNVWLKTPTEDVALQVLRTDGTLQTLGLSYTGNDDRPFMFADLDFNNSIDSADWDIYIAGALTDLSEMSPAEAYQAGDLNNDGLNNLNDMDIFISAFDAANGPGAFATMVAGNSVPEPGTGLLVFVSAAVVVGYRVRSKLWRLSSVVWNHHPYAAVVVGMLLTLAMLTREPANAAGILWDAPFAVDDVTDVVAPAGGTLVFAADFNTEADFGPDDGMINGVAFTQVDAAGIAGLMSHTFTSGPNFGAAAFPGGTGDADLDNLMNSHSWMGGDPATASVTLEGLTPGVPYQIQVLGAADTRGCCAARAYEPDDGEGNFTTGVSYTRGDLASVVGTFTADADTQTFQWRSLNDATGNNDPSMSGLIVHQLAGVFTLDLEVNTTSGTASIRNASELDFNVQGYEVSSPGGSLSTDAWTVPSGWDKAGGASATGLLAGALDGVNDSYSLLAEEGSPALSLGTAYDTGVGAEDLEFRFFGADGVIRAGTVSYVMSVPLPGDFNGNGTVGLADYTVWRDNLDGSHSLSGNGDETGGSAGVVDAADYALWKQNFGASAPTAAGLEGSAVPEPSAWMLGLVGMAAVAGYRRWKSVCHHVVACVVVIACVAFAGTCMANSSIDRLYLMGDDPDEDAANAVGGAVGTGPDNVGIGTDTLDSDDTGDFADLAATGSPVYIDVSATSGNLAQVRPGATPHPVSGHTFGILFDGVDDYLFGEQLNYPATSFGSVAGGGPEDYEGIANRGFQLWVYPDSAKQGQLQNVVLDSNQHGVRINEAGNWVMRYDGADVDSMSPVAFDQWAHVMVVRPFGGSGPNGGSILYVDGEAVAASPGGYDIADTSGLTLGSNTGTTPGTDDFFQGVLDDMSMFVMGQSISGTDYGAFNLLEDNDFVKSSTLSNLTGEPGDIDQDGDVDEDDIDALILGWGTENLVNGVRAGDVNTILNGDLNLDGIVNLLDAYAMHNALLSAGAAGLDFSRLGAGANVPEPSTQVLSVVGLGLATLFIRCKALGGSTEPKA